MENEVVKNLYVKNFQQKVSFCHRCVGTFRNGLFQKKSKQGGRSENMEFPGVLKKKHGSSRGKLKKKWMEIPRVFKKNYCRIYMCLGF